MTAVARLRFAPVAASHLQRPRGVLRAWLMGSLSAGGAPPPRDSSERAQRPRANSASEFLETISTYSLRSPLSDLRNGRRASLGIWSQPPYRNMGGSRIADHTRLGPRRRRPSSLTEEVRHSLSGECLCDLDGVSEGSFTAQPRWPLSCRSR